MRAPSELTNVVVLADTHIRATAEGSLRRWLPGAAESHLREADVILHLGDVVDGAVLERLRTYAPVLGVLGNNDRDLVGRLPESLQVELAGVRIGMIHDSGAARGRAQRMKRRFPDADVVVFGHSHTPVNEPGEEGQRLFNPGSPTQRRTQPCHSLGRWLLGGGAVIDMRIERLG